MKKIIIALLVLIAMAKQGSSQVPAGASPAISDLIRLSESTQNLDSAFVYADKACVSADSSGDHVGFALAINRRAVVKSRRFDIYGALNDLTVAAAKADSLKNKSILRTTYRNFSNVFASVSNFAYAYRYEQMYAAISDSLHAEESARLTADMHSRYEAGQREKQQALSEKDAIEKELRESREDISLWKMASGAAAFIAVAALCGLLLSRRRKVRPAPIPAAAPVISTSRREDPTDISYLKSLRESFVPSASFLSSHLPDHFILQQNVDGSAGDLYWAHSPGQGEVLLAAACSASNGVRADLIAVICGTLLNSIVRERKVHHPNLALNVLRDNLTLLMKNEPSIEELSIVLCRLNFEKMLLSYSAANLAIWLARGTGLQELDGDKLGMRKEGESVKPFTLKNVPLEKGDIIYIFTGLNSVRPSEQQSNKYKELHKLLLSMHNETLETQRSMLEDSFAKLKSSNELAGNITLIGIKI